MIMCTIFKRFLDGNGSLDNLKHIKSNPLASLQRVREGPRGCAGNEDFLPRLLTVRVLKAASAWASGRHLPVS